MNPYWRLALAVVCTLLFVCGAMLPGELRETVSKAFWLGGIDAWAHLFFCALMALLLGWNGLQARYVLICVLVLGGSIELAQLWIPGRSSSWDDMADNALGTVLGIVFLWIGRQFLTRESDG